MYIDYAFGNCKNLQVFSSIEMYYYVYKDGRFAIDYKFHSVELDIWKEILEIHLEDIKNYWIVDNYLKKNIKLNNIPEYSYYDLTVISDDYSFYLNINYLFYFSKNDGNMKLDKDIINKTIENGIWER